MYTVHVHCTVEMVTGRAARGPGRAGPELPGPRAFTGLNGPKDFLCIVRGQLSTGGSKLICIEQMIVNRKTVLYNN